MKELLKLKKKIEESQEKPESRLEEISKEIAQIEKIAKNRYLEDIEWSHIIDTLYDDGKIEYNKLLAEHNKLLEEEGKTDEKN